MPQQQNTNRAIDIEVRFNHDTNDIKTLVQDAENLNQDFADKFLNNVDYESYRKQTVNGYELMSDDVKDKLTKEIQGFVDAVHKLNTDTQKQGKFYNDQVANLFEIGGAINSKMRWMARAYNGNKTNAKAFVTDDSLSTRFAQAEAYGRRSDAFETIASRGKVGGIDINALEQQALLLNDVVSREHQRYAISQKSGTLSVEQLANKMSEGQDSALRKALERNFTTQQFTNDDVRDIAKYFILSRANMFSYSDFQDSFRKRNKGTGDPVETVFDIMPGKFASAFSHVVKGDKITPTDKNDPKYSKYVNPLLSGKIADYIANSDQRDYLFKFLEKVNIGERKNKEYQLYSPTHGQVNQLAYDILKEYTDIKKGIAGFEKDNNKIFGNQQRLVEYNNKRSSALLGLMGILGNTKNNPDLVIADEFNTKRIGDVQAGTSKITGIAYPDQFFAPRTRFGEHGKVEYVDLDEVKRSNDFVRQAILQKRGEFTDPLVSIARSSFSESLGLTGNGTYGMGRNEYGIVKPETPPVVEIDTSNLFEKNDQGKYVIKNGVTQKQIMEATGGTSFMYGPEGRQEAYTIVFNNKNVATAIKASEKKRIDEEDRKAHLPSRWQNFNITGLVNEDYGITAGQIETVRRMATPSTSFKKFYGIENDPRVAMINTDAEYAANGIPKNGTKGKGYMVDGVIYMDPTIFGKDNVEENGFAAQLRYANVIKGMGQGFDWRAVETSVQGATYDADNKLTNKRSLASKWQNEGLQYTYEINDKNKYGMSHWVASHLANETDVRLLRQGKVRDFSDTTSTVTIDGKSVEVTGRIIDFSKDQQAFKEARAARFIDVFDDTIQALASNTTIKNAEKFAYMFKEDYEAIFKGNKNFAERTITLAQVSQETGQVIKKEDAGREVVRLIAPESNEMLRLAGELTGGLRAANTEENFMSDKDFLSRQAFLSLGAPKKLQELSDRNYDIRRKELATAQGRIKYLIGSDSRLRSLYEAQGDEFLFSKEVNARAKEYMDMLEHNQFNEMRMLLPGKKSVELAVVEPTSVMESLGYTQSQLEAFAKQDPTNPLSKIIRNKYDRNRDVVYTDKFNGGRVYTFRSPTSPNTIGYRKVVSDADVINYMKSVGYSPNAIALSAEQHWQHNTGDFDGDTIEMLLEAFGTDIDRDVRTSVKELNKGVAKVEKEMDERAAAQQGQNIKENKRKSRDTNAFGRLDEAPEEYQARTEHMLNNMNVMSVLGAADAATNAAVLYDPNGDTEEEERRYRAIAEAKRIYDEASTGAKKGVIPEVTGDAAKFIQYRNSIKYLQDIAHFEQAGVVPSVEIIKEKPIAKNSIESIFAQIYTSQQEMLSGQKKVSRASIVNSLANLAEQDDFSDEANAVTRKYLTLIDSQIQGMHLITEDDIKDLESSLPKLYEELATAGTIMDKNDDAKTYWTNMSNYISALERSITFLREEALNETSLNKMIDDANERVKAATKAKDDADTEAQNALKEHSRFHYLKGKQLSKTEKVEYDALNQDIANIEQTRNDESKRIALFRSTLSTLESQRKPLDDQLTRLAELANKRNQGQTLTQTEETEYRNLIKQENTIRTNFNTLTGQIQATQANLAHSQQEYNKTDMSYQRYNQLQKDKIRTQQEEAEYQGMLPREKEINDKRKKTKSEAKKAEKTLEVRKSNLDMLEQIREGYNTLGQKGGTWDQLQQEYEKKRQEDLERTAKAQEKFKNANKDKFDESELYTVDRIIERLGRTSAKSNNSVLIDKLRFGATTLEHLISKDAAANLLAGKAGSESRVRVYDLKDIDSDMSKLDQQDPKLVKKRLFNNELKDSFSEYFGNKEDYENTFADYAANIVNSSYHGKVNAAATLGSAIHLAYQKYVDEMLKGNNTKSLTQIIEQSIIDGAVGGDNNMPYVVSLDENRHITRVSSPGNHGLTENMNTRVMNLLYGEDSNGNANVYGEGNAKYIEKLLKNGTVIAREGKMVGGTIGGFTYAKRDAPILATYKDPNGGADTDVQHKVMPDYIMAHEDAKTGKVIVDWIDYKPNEKGAMDSLIQQLSYLHHYFEEAASAAEELNKELKISGNDINKVSDEIKQNPYLAFIERDNATGEALKTADGSDFQFNETRISGLADKTRGLLQIRDEAGEMSMRDMARLANTFMTASAEVQRGIANAITSGESKYTYKEPGSGEDKEVNIPSLVKLIGDKASEEWNRGRRAKEYVAEQREKLKGNSEFAQFIGGNPLVAEMFAHKYTKDLETIDQIRSDMYKADRRLSQNEEPSVYDEFSMARKKLKETLEEQTMQSLMVKSAGNTEISARADAELAKAQIAKAEAEAMIDKTELKAVKEEPVLGAQRIRNMRYGEKNSAIRNAASYIRGERNRFKTYRMNILQNDKYTQVDSHAAGAIEDSYGKKRVFINNEAKAAYEASLESEREYNREAADYVNSLAKSFARTSAIEANSFAGGAHQQQDPFEAVDAYYEKRQESLLSYIEEYTKIEKDALNDALRADDADSHEEAKGYLDIAETARKNLLLVQDQQDEYFGESILEMTHRQDRERAEKDYARSRKRRRNKIKNRHAGRFVQSVNEARIMREDLLEERERAKEAYDIENIRYQRNEKRISDIRKDLTDKNIVLSGKERLEKQNELEARIANRETLRTNVERKAKQKEEADKDYKTVSALGPVMETIGVSVKNVMSGFGKRAFRMAMQEVRTFVAQFTAAMTDIQMVTLKTDAEINKLGASIIEKAVKNGASVQEASKAAAALYRQGLSDKEVDQRLDSVLRFSKVSNVDAQTATKLGTVAINSEMADSTQEIFDIVSAISDSAATDAKAITQALQRSIYSAKVSGVTTEELVSMAAAITSNTQLSGSVTGTALSNIFSRMRKIGSGELAYDENGNATSRSSLQQALARVGIDLYEGDNMRSAFQVLRDLGNWWKDNENSDAIKNQIATQLGGTGRQASLFMSLMDAFTQVDESGKLVIDTFMNIAEAADGIVDKKMDVWTESLQGSIDSTKSSFDGLVETMHLDETAKGPLDFLKNLFENLTDLEKHTGAVSAAVKVIGALGAIVAALAAIAAAPVAALATGVSFVAAAITGNMSDSMLNSIKTPENNLFDETKWQAEYDKTLKSEQAYKEARKIQDKISNKQAVSSEERQQLDKHLLELGYLVDFKNAIKSTSESAFSVSDALDEAAANLKTTKENLIGQKIKQNIVSFDASYEKYINENAMGGITESELDTIVGLLSDESLADKDFTEEQKEEYGNIIVKFLKGVSGYVEDPDEQNIIKKYTDSNISKKKVFEDMFGMNVGGWLSGDLGTQNLPLYKIAANVLFGQEIDWWKAGKNQFKEVDWKTYASTFMNVFNGAMQYLLAPEDWFANQNIDLLKEYNFDKSALGIKEGVNLEKTVMDLINEDYRKWIEQTDQKDTPARYRQYLKDNGLTYGNIPQRYSFEEYILNNKDRINATTKDVELDTYTKMKNDWDAIVEGAAPDDLTTAYKSMYDEFANLTPDQMNVDGFKSAVSKIEGSFNRVKEKDLKLVQMLKTYGDQETISEENFETLKDYLFKQSRAITPYTSSSDQAAIKLADFDRLLLTKDINKIRDTEPLSQDAAKELLPVIGEDWNNEDIVKNFGASTKRFARARIEAIKFGGESTYTTVDLAKDAQDLMNGVTDLSQYSEEHLKTLFSTFKGLNTFMARQADGLEVSGSIKKDIERQIEATLKYGEGASYIASDADRISDYYTELGRARSGFAKLGVENIRQLFGDSIVDAIPNMSLDEFRKLYTYAEQSILGGEKFDKAARAKELEEQLAKGEDALDWWNNLDEFYQKQYEEVGGNQVGAYFGNLKQGNVSKGIIDKQLEDIRQALSAASITGINKDKITQAYASILNIGANPAAFWNTIASSTRSSDQTRNYRAALSRIDTNAAIESDYAEVAEMLGVRESDVRNNTSIFRQQRDMFEKAKTDFVTGLLSLFVDDISSLDSLIGDNPSASISDIINQKVPEDVREYVQAMLESEGYDIDAHGIKLDATPVLKSIQDLINAQAEDLLGTNDMVQFGKITDIYNRSKNMPDFIANLDEASKLDPILFNFINNNAELRTEMAKAGINDKAMYNELTSNIKEGRGNVDMLNRPSIPGTEMNAAGWTGINPEDTVTLFSSNDTYQFGNGEAYSLLFTPILPDGTKLTPKEFNDYITEVTSQESFAAAKALDEDKYNLLVDSEKANSITDHAEADRVLAARAEGYHEAQQEMLNVAGVVSWDAYVAQGGSGESQYEYKDMGTYLEKKRAGTFGNTPSDYDPVWYSLFGTDATAYASWANPDIAQMGMDRLRAMYTSSDENMRYQASNALDTMGQFLTGEDADALARIREELSATGPITEETKSAFERLSQIVGNKLVESFTRANKYSAETRKFMESIHKGGTEAANALNEVYKSGNQLNDNVYSLELWNKGDRKNSNMLKYVSSVTGYDEADLKKMKPGSAKAREVSERVNIVLEAERVEWEKSQANKLDALIEAGLLEITGKENSVELMSEVFVNGQFNMEGFLKVLQYIESQYYSSVNSLNTTLKDVYATVGFHIDANLVGFLANGDYASAINAIVNGDKAVSSTVSTNNSKFGTSYSGGKGSGKSSGGSGKSAADKLIERLKHGQSLYEHQIKMYNFEETRYQNLDQLTNYGRVLEGEIELEKSFLPVLQQNIQALKNEMNTVSEGGEDWYKLRDALLDAEEKYADITNTIDENNKKLKENQQAILKTHTDLEEMVVAEIEKRIQRQRDMLGGTVEMQTNVLNAIKDRYKKEWELIKQDIDRKRKALEEEKSLIDERLNKRKSAEDEAAKYEELAKLKAQYASVSMDSSRTKDAAALRKQIQDIEKEIGWDRAEAEAKAVSDAIQDQIDAYDEFASTGDEDLDKLLEDANNFSVEITRIMSMSHDQLMTWLSSNDTEYQNSLAAAQEQIIQSWDDTWKKMYGIVDTWWPEVNEILSSETSFINYMTQSIDYTTASLDAQKQMMYEWMEAYRLFLQAPIDTAKFGHTDPGNWGGSEYTGVSSNSSGGGTGGGGGGRSGSGSGVNTSPDLLNGGGESITYNYKLPKDYDLNAALNDNSLMPYYVRYTGENKVTKEKIPYAYYYATKDAAERAYKSVLSSGAALINSTIEMGSVKDGIISREIVVSKTGNSYSGLSSTSTIASSSATQTTSVNGTATVSASSGSAKLRSGPSTDYAQKGTVSSGQKLTIIGKSGNWYQTTNGWISGNLLKNIKTYSLGGEADFTGLIQIDGTTDKPERILNWKQTKDFNQLTKVLSSSALEDLHSALSFMDTWSQFSSVLPKLMSLDASAFSSPTVSNSIGEITVILNEAKLEEDADYDAVAEKVGKLFTKELAKQGFNTRFSY